MSHRFPLRAITAALLGLATVGAAPTATADPASAPAARTVPLYSGTVTARTAHRFLSLVAENRDAVIGLDIVIKPSRPGELRRNGYLALYSDDQLSISLTDRKGLRGGLEVVKNGPVPSQNGDFRLSGLFVVESGGYTQGVLSFGLIPADAATVRAVQAGHTVRQTF